MLTAQGFAAGRAQPQQQFRGTPYNPQQGQNFAGFGSQQGGAFSAWNPNIANDAQAQRPPAFQAQTFNFDGTQSQMPNFQQRDAFINNINTQLGQMQGQSWNQPMGAPQFNFPQMWGQAGQQVQQGFQNPFAGQLGGFGPTHAGHAPPASPQPGGGQFQDLFQQFGFTPPAGFMDALIQRLQGGQQSPLAGQMPGGTGQQGRELGMPAAQPPNRSPPTADQFRQGQQQRQQQQFMDNLHRQANVQAGATQDELMLGLVNSSRGGATVRREDMNMLPESMRDAMSLYSDLAGKLQGSGTDPFREDYAAALQQLTGRLSERVQASQSLQSEYGMSPEDAAAWVDREMPLPTSAEVWRRIQAKGAERKAQERAAALTRQAAASRPPSLESMRLHISRLEEDLAAARRGEKIPGPIRTVQQREQELKQAQQRLSQAAAPAAWAWEQVVATAQREGRRITPQEAELYTKMQQEQQQAAAKKRSAV